MCGLVLFDLNYKNACQCYLPSAVLSSADINIYCVFRFLMYSMSCYSHMVPNHFLLLRFLIDVVVLTDIVSISTPWHIVGLVDLTVGSFDLSVKV